MKNVAVSKFAATIFIVAFIILVHDMQEILKKFY